MTEHILIYNVKAMFCLGRVWTIWL